MSERAELEVGPYRDRDTHVCFDWYHLLMIGQLPPHFTSPIQEEPDLLHGSMRNRDRSLTGAEFKMRETPTIQVQEYSNIRSIRGNRFTVNGKSLRTEVSHLTL